MNGHTVSMNGYTVSMNGHTVSMNGQTKYDKWITCKSEEYNLMTSFLMNEECLLFHGSLLNLIPFFVHLVSAIKKTSCHYQEEIPLY